MRNWHITLFLNKHLSWVSKRTVSPFRWDGSFEHPKHMFELESHSKDSLKLSASCRSSKSSRADVNWEVHHMSVDLQCFFSECMLVMHGSRGVQLWQCFLLLFFCSVFFLVWGGKDSNTTIHHIYINCWLPLYRWSVMDKQVTSIPPPNTWKWGGGGLVTCIHHIYINCWFPLYRWSVMEKQVTRTPPPPISRYWGGGGYWLPVFPLLTTCKAGTSN